MDHLIAFSAQKSKMFIPNLLYTIAFSHQNDCKNVDHQIVDVKKHYLSSSTSNFFLPMGIIWEGNITWSKLLLNIRISLTASSGLEKKQNDVL